MFLYASWLMITYYTCLISVVICCELLPNGDGLCCSHDQPFIKDSNDCGAAIKMIPAGTLETSFVRYGIADKPISLEMDQNGGRELRLPAAFVAGSCAVLVRASNISVSLSLLPPQPPQQAATAMYHQIWPNVKIAAKTILQKCVHTKIWYIRGRTEGGTIFTKTMLEGWNFQYSVQVRGAPNTMLKGGIGTNDWIKGYHIYQSKEAPWVYFNRGKRLRKKAADVARSPSFTNLPTPGVRRSKRTRS